MQSQQEQTQQQEILQFLPLGNEISKPFIIENVSPVSPQFKATTNTARKDSVVSAVDLDLTDELSSVANNGTNGALLSVL